MALSDFISDVITRIRNAHMAGHLMVMLPASKSVRSLLQVLQDEGYILSYADYYGKDNRLMLKVELKYYKGAPVISKIERVSKPGRRVYKKSNEIKKVYGGLGISVVSTPSGVMSDYRARSEKLGGEIWCNVY